MRHSGSHLPPTARPEPASDSTKDSGGEKSSGSQIRLVPEVDVVRRAGSSQTPSIPSSETEVASEWTTVAFAEQDQVHRGARGCGLVHFHRGNHQVHRRQGHRIRPQPAAEVRHVADSGLHEPLRVPGRHREPGGLLKAAL